MSRPSFGRRDGSVSDLGCFSSRSLAAELDRRGLPTFVSLAQASERQLRTALSVLTDPDAWHDEIDVARKPLDEAAARFRRGEIADALHWLERALPPDFAGLSACLTTPAT